MKLILINGQGGSGKSNVGNTLVNEIDNCTYIDADFLVVIISGLTMNQTLLDKFLTQLNKSVEVLFVWLRASKEVRILRKEKRNRDDSDKKEQFGFLDKVYPDINTIEIKNGKAIFIDTSSKSIEETVEEIRLK